MVADPDQRGRDIVTRPHPWLPEAHELGPTPTTSRWWRIRTRLARILHPHGDLLNQLDTLGPDPDLVKIDPWDGHVIAIACPACGLWRRDPTTNCPGCGL